MASPPVASGDAPRLTAGWRLLLIALALTVLGATAALWARYGTAVFVEMLAAAWAACF